MWNSNKFNINFDVHRAYNKLLGCCVCCIYCTNTTHTHSHSNRTIAMKLKKCFAIHNRQSRNSKRQNHNLKCEKKNYYCCLKNKTKQKSFLYCAAATAGYKKVAHVVCVWMDHGIDSSVQSMSCNFFFTISYFVKDKCIQ